MVRYAASGLVLLVLFLLGAVSAGGPLTAADETPTPALAVAQNECGTSGFTLRNPQPNSQISQGFWGISVVAERGDAGDELFARSMTPSSPSATFTATVKWVSFNYGSQQRAFPLFLAPAATTNPGDEPGSAAFVARSGGVVQARFVDASGVVRLAQDYFIGSNTMYLLIGHDAATGVLQFGLRRWDGSWSANAFYSIGTNPGDGFLFETMGIGTDGQPGPPNGVPLVGTVESPCLSGYAPTQCAGMPLNNPPSVPPTPTSDGLGNGQYGWAGHEYTFTTAGSTDVDGDPIFYIWSWGDGSGAFYGDVTKSYAWGSTGSFGATVSTMDQPGPRPCFGTPASSGIWPGSTLNFQVIADFRATLTQPINGQSCAANALVASPGGVNVIAGLCGIRGSVAATPASLIDRVDFRVDGARFASDAVAPYSVSYNSLLFSPGTHTMDVCAFAKNDKYERLFCSGAYNYLNV